MAEALARRAPPPGLDKSELRSIFRCSNCSNYINFLRTDKCLLRCIKFHYLCATCYWKTESCPLDNCLAGALLPDKNVALPSFWNVVKFRCLLSDQGCDAIIKAGDMQQHLKNDCPFRHLLVRCPHGYCNKLMPKAMLLDHVSGVHNRPPSEVRTQKLAIKIDFKEPDGPNFKHEPETKVLGMFRYFDHNFLLMAHFFHETEFDTHYVYATVFPAMEEEAEKFRLAVRFHGDTKFEEVPVVNYERAAIDIIRDKQAVKMKTHYCRTITKHIDERIGVFLPLQFGILEVTESVTAIILEKTFWFDGDPKLKKLKYEAESTPPAKPARVKPNRRFADTRTDLERGAASAQTNGTALPHAVEKPEPLAKQDKGKKFVSFLGTSTDEPEASGSAKKAANEDAVAAKPKTTTAKAPPTERKIHNVTIKFRSDSKIVQDTSAPAVRLQPPPVEEKKASRKYVQDKSSAPDATAAEANGTPKLSELCTSVGVDKEVVCKEEPRKYTRPMLNKKAAKTDEPEPSTTKAKMQILDPQKTANVTTPGSETEPKVTVLNPVEAKPSDEPVPDDKSDSNMVESADKNVKAAGGQADLPISIRELSVQKDDIHQENADLQCPAESAADIFANDDQPEREVKQMKIEDAPVPEVQAENFADFNNLEPKPAKPEACETKDLAAIEAPTESVPKQPVGPEPLPTQVVAVTSLDEPKLETAGESVVEESETTSAEVGLGLETKQENVECVEDDSARSAVKHKPHAGEAESPEAATLVAAVAANANPRVEVRDHVQPDEELPTKQLDSSEDNTESAKAEPNTNQDEEILLECHEVKDGDEVKDESGKPEIMAQIDSHLEDPQSNSYPDAKENNAEPAIEDCLDPNLDGNAAMQDDAKSPLAIQDEIEIKAEEVHSSPVAVEAGTECGLDVSIKVDSDQDVTEVLQIKNEVKSKEEDSQESQNAREAVTESVSQVSQPETGSLTENAEDLSTAENVTVQDQNEVKNKTEDAIDPEVIPAAAESALNVSTSGDSDGNEPQPEDSSQGLGMKVEGAEGNQQSTWSVSSTIESVADAGDVPSVDNADLVRLELETTETTEKPGNVITEAELVELEQGLRDEVELVPANELEDVQENISACITSSETVKPDTPLDTPTVLENAAKLPKIIEEQESVSLETDGAAKENVNIIPFGSDDTDAETQVVQPELVSEPSQNVSLKTEETEPVEEVDGAQTEEPYLAVDPVESDSIVEEIPHLMNDTVEKAVADEGEASVEASQIQEQSKVEESVPSVPPTSETTLATQTEETAPTAVEDVTHEVSEDSAPTGTIVLSSASPTPAAAAEITDNHATVDNHDIELEGSADEPVVAKQEQTLENVSSATKNEVENAQETEKPFPNAETDLIPATSAAASNEIIEKPVPEKMQESATDLSEIEKEPANDPVVDTTEAPEQLEQPTAEESSPLVLPDVPTTDPEINLEPQPATATDPEQVEALNLNDEPVLSLELEATEIPGEEGTMESKLHLEPHTINGGASATPIVRASETEVSLEPIREDVDKIEDQVQLEVEDVVANLVAETEKASMDPETPAKSEEASVLVKSVKKDDEA